jgi:uncharacterized membrane protein YbhN (UPF0104 family)
VRRAILLFVAAVVVYAVIALLADAPKLVAALVAFHWAALPVAIALTLGNYGLRFLRWSYFLRVVGLEVPVRQSLPIFLSGLGMAITPGKLGELIKSHLLREAHGTPLSVSAPVVLADRLTDLLAMLVLALGGLLSRDGGPVLAIVVLLVCLGTIQLLRWRRAADGVLGLLARAPVIGRRSDAIRALYESSFLLLGPGPLLVSTVISTIAWLCECIALYVILLGLGLPASWSLGIEATYAYALSTLIGAVTLLPGGLGAQELSLASLLLFAGMGVTREQAATATILVRLVTFWLGIAIGLAALAYSLRTSRR